MNTKILPCLLISLFVLISCDENDETGNDAPLQKFWTLSGYFDKNGIAINLPDFDPDTLFHYEVNVLFMWNENSEKYEIQGQGPYDIFWGEYTASGHQLHNTSFETTRTLSESITLAEYDNQFFTTLKKVTSYSIIDNALKLYYDSNSEYMLFDLKDQQYKDSEEYITAKINGINWQGDQEYTSAFVQFNDNTNSFTIDLGATSQEVLSNGFRYDVSFTLNLPPTRGEFEFNNDGIMMNSKDGVLGICYGRKDENDVDTRSTTGILAITQLNRSFVEGYFYFDAAGVGDDVGVNCNVTNGKFLIQISSPPDWFEPF
ncbi:MAG: META domain-containing protein [Chryseolinea sp.]